MDKRLDRRTKDKIGANVRYKSYGTFTPKGAGADAVQDDDNLYVRGFFTSDTIDEVGDIITREATEDAVKRWRQWGNIRTMHDAPSGRIDKIGVEDGLAWNEVITVPVDESTKTLIEGGVLKAYSVGIIPREYDINEVALEEAGEDADTWFLPLIIHSYDMVEISYVDHPANYSATVSEVSSGKAKGMGLDHKAVLFKNSEAMGDVIDMDEVEVSAEEQELENEEVVDSPEDVTEEVEDSVEESVDATLDPEIDKGDEEEEEESVEKVEEDAFDVALAVGEIKSSLGDLDSRMTGLSESLEGLADMVVERLLDAMTASEADEVVDEAADEAVEEDEVDVVEDKVFDEEAFVERVAEKVLKGITEILAPEVSRSARVTGEDTEDIKPETSAEKTKRFMEMSPADRRLEMKKTIDEIRNNK